MSNQVIYINGELNDEVIALFIKHYNLLNKSLPISIYINTNGGYTCHAEVIINIINSNYKNITLIASGDIFSAGFDIFFFTKCKKEILHNVVGMTHFSYSSFELSENGEPKTDYDKLLLAYMKKRKQSTIKTLQLIGLSTSELNKVKAGKDCYFSTERLKELLISNKLKY